MMRCAVLALALCLPAAGLAADNSLQRFVRTLVDREIDPGVRYTSALVDLNGDRRPEAVVRVMGPGYCGTGGCGLYVLQQRGGGWRVVSDISVAHAPIRVLNSRTRGWRDVGVIVAGGGIYRPYEARLRFDGRSYTRNPTVSPATRLPPGVPGRVLITRDDRGRRLF